MNRAQKTLLLVEDNADDRLLFSIAIGPQRSFSLQTANNGQQAIHYLEGRGQFANRGKYPLPAIIVLDLKLPKVNGFEFLGWRSTSPRSLCSIPVVVLEGGENPEDQQRAQEMGAIVTYSKPSGLARLQEIVEEICTLFEQRFQHSDGLRVIRIPQAETHKKAA